MDVLDGNGTERIGYPGGRGVDFQVKERQNGIYLRPVHGATLSPVRGIGPSACEATQYSKQPVRIDTMPVGSLMCFRTSEKRYGQMTIGKVVGPPTNAVELSYEVW